MTNIDEIVKALRWLSNIDNNEFIFCAENCGKAADAIEALQSENISLRAERDALLKAVENPCVQERGD